MKKTADKPITQQQLKALHVIFSKEGLDENERHDYIGHITGGRTRSSKELTFDEARLIISVYADKEKAANREAARKIVSSIYKLSFEISFLNKDYRQCNTAADYEMNKAKINSFCRNRTKFRKNISDMSLDELKEVHRQFEILARKEKTHEEAEKG